MCRWFKSEFRTWRKGACDFSKKQIRFPFIENTGVPLKNDSYNVHKIYLKFSSKIGMITFFVNFIKIKHNKQKPKVFIFSISIMPLYKRLKYTVIAIFWQNNLIIIRNWNRCLWHDTCKSNDKKKSPRKSFKQNWKTINKQ